MNILLDESAPRLIKTRLTDFSISTVQEMGWTGLKNGELLTLAEQQFDAFITADQQLRYQQNLAGRRLAILVLPSNQVPMVTRLLPMIAQTLRDMAPGAFVELPLPS